MSKENILFKKINLPNRIIRRRIIISIVGIILFLLGLCFLGMHTGPSPIGALFQLFISYPLIIIGLVLSLIGLSLLFLQLRGERVIIRMIPIFIILLLLWEVSELLSGQQYQQSIAIDIKSSFLCKTTFFSLIHPRFVDDCYFEIAKEKKDYNICDKITIDWRKDDCYEELAIIVEDESICEKISYDPARPYQKNDCYIEIAKKKEDSTICDKIMSNECYYELAIIEQNESLCGKILYGSYRQYNCYTEIAKQKEDPTICSKIIVYGKTIEGGNSLRRLELERDECYGELAFIKKDISICENILDNWERNNCYEILSKPK